MSDKNTSNNKTQNTQKIDCDKYRQLCDPFEKANIRVRDIEMPSAVVQYAEHLREHGQTWQSTNYNILAAMFNESGMPQLAEILAQVAIESALETDFLTQAEAWQRKASAFHLQNLPDLESQAIEQAINSLSMARS